MGSCRKSEFVSYDAGNEVSGSVSANLEEPGHDYVAGVIASWRPERSEEDLQGFEVSARVMRLSHLMIQIIDRDLADLKIKQADLTLLAALNRSGPPYTLSPSALDRASLVASGSISHRINRLAQLGYLVKTSNPDDGRGVLVTITQSGIAAVERGLDAQARMNSHLLRSVSPAERSQLGSLLESVLAPIDPRSDTSQVPSQESRTGTSRSKSPASSAE